MKPELREADRLEVTVLVDNYTDLLLMDNTEVVQRPAVAPKALLAEHGLSYLIKVYSGEEQHTVLMDAGLSAISLFHNAEVLEKDLIEVESVILSHGHFDHFGGLEEFFNRQSRKIPLILHPDAFSRRRINIEFLNYLLDLPALDEEILEKTGAVINKTKTPSTAASGLILVPGEIEKTTDFEIGFPWAEVKIDGNWVNDPFLDDQGIAVKIKGKGLAVINGCAHSGVINTVRHTQKLAGEERVHAVMGGFHLTGAIFESVIPPTIEEMKKINPDFIIPMHCSGWKATNEFARQMSEQFILNSVGTTYVFS